MALSSYCHWFIRAGGSTSNCGFGFDPSVTAGMLTDGAATVATGNSPVFTSASYTFVAGDVGHWLYIAPGGTWYQGYYQIASVAAGAATLSAAIGAGYAPVFGLPTLVAGCSSAASPTGAVFTMCYGDADAATVDISDLTSTADPTATSASNPFTPVMVGNIIKLSGTGATAGYYAVAAYTSAGSIELDRNSGTYTAGVAKLGGATSNLYTTFNSSASPASPLVQGHTINVRGSGSADPTGAYDFTWNDTTYPSFPAGSGYTNNIVLRGYNGRPYIDWAWCMGAGWWVDYLKFKITGGNGATGALTSGMSSRLIVDMNGQNTYLHRNCLRAWNNYIYNSSATKTGGGYACIHMSGGSVWGNVIIECRQVGISISDGSNSISRNIIARAGSSGIYNYASDGSYADKSTIDHNTIHTCAGSGIVVTNRAGFKTKVLHDNLLISNGGYGIEFTGSDAVATLPTVELCRNNAFYNNTSGAYDTGVWQAPGDVILTGDPCVAPASNDFSLNNTAGAGAACRAAARGMPDGFTATTNYLDIGAVQHQDSAGGATGHWAAVFGG